ncbi:hypothetical protein KQX54_000125, partial [Cotesia glomerata]
MGEQEFQCYLCKQTNLKSPKECEFCHNVFHPCCLKKKHKIMNEKGDLQICEGNGNNNIDNEQRMETDNEKTRKRKKNGEEESVDNYGISLKVDGILNKIEELGFRQDDMMEEMRE